MGWANCGEDSQGRPIGYAHEAICDEPGCEKKIDRGVGYACGGMHGDCGGAACEGYFCDDHRICVDAKPGSHAATELYSIAVCRRCEARLQAEGQLESEDDEE